jgi:hypothetical protein
MYIHKKQLNRGKKMSSYFHGSTFVVLVIFTSGFYPPFYFHMKAFVHIFPGGLLPALSFQREGFDLSVIFGWEKDFCPGGLSSFANLFLFPKFT